MKCNCCITLCGGRVLLAPHAEHGDMITLIVKQYSTQAQIMALVSHFLKCIISFDATFVTPKQMTSLDLLMLSVERREPTPSWTQTLDKH